MGSGCSESRKGCLPFPQIPSDQGPPRAIPYPEEVGFGSAILPNSRANRESINEMFGQYDLFFFQGDWLAI
jgi:hypothetical protein